MELLDKLGINWKLLVAQIVNFVILFAILSKFVFDPMSKFLRERSDKIAKSLDEARAIDERMQIAERDRGEIIAKARFESEIIITEAKRAAEVKQAEHMSKTKRIVEDMVAAAKLEISSERKAALQAAKAEIADLVIDASGKILGEEISSRWEKKRIEELVASVRRV